MKKIFLILLSLFSFSQVEAACIPPREIVDHPRDARWSGVYQRVHPKGDFVMYSDAPGSGGHTEIIDLRTRGADGKIQPKTVNTPMINETYPVEGSWTLMASPNHDNSQEMRYYRFDEVLKSRTAARAAFSDREHNEWYHSSAELPGSTPRSIKFRTMLYDPVVRDYEAQFDANGKLVNVKKGEIKQICGGQTMYEPILSKDGTEVSGIVGSTTKIFKINRDGSCTVADDLGYATSKTSFSYPQAGKKGKVTFTGNATVVVDGVPRMRQGVFIYDRDTKKTQLVSAERGASYPGFTKDGRVIYTLVGQRKTVIVDPNQLKADGTPSNDQSKCIQATGSAARASAAPRKAGAVK